MDISGEYRIAAPRDTVWDALNDPDILRQCIPGCQSLEKTGDNTLEAKVTTKIGPVKANFAGAVELQDLNPPESYKIVGEGKGGVAGYAKGGADVHLAEDGAETILTYKADANVGGKIAQLGSRLIQSTAKKMADEFFGKFSELVAAKAAEGPAEISAAEESAASATAAEQAPVDTPAEHQETAVEHVAHVVSDAAHAAGDKVVQAEKSVEEAASKGLFGGPMMWGWIALAVVVVLLLIMSGGS